MAVEVVITVQDGVQINVPTPSLDFLLPTGLPFIHDCCTTHRLCWGDTQQPPRLATCGQRPVDRNHRRVIQMIANHTQANSIATCTGLSMWRTRRSSQFSGRTSTHPSAHASTHRSTCRFTYPSTSISGIGSGKATRWWNALSVVSRRCL